MPFRQIKTSYNAGELSEYMAAREDINKYHNGCSKLINATVLPHGGVVKRSGTEFIGKAPNKAKLLPFEFSVDDALVLEFSNLLLRFYKDGDRVYEDDVEIASTTEDDPVLVTTDAAHNLSDDNWLFLEDIDTATSLNDKIYQITVTGAGGVTKFTLQDTEGNDIDGTGIGVGGAAGSCKRVYQIVSPYTSAQSFQIHVTQSADVMYIAHEDVHPKKLSRISDTNWTIADVAFTGGPFLDDNIDSADTLKITGSKHTGANNAGVLTDSTQDFVVDALIGFTIYNITDSSSGTITDNDAITITVGGGMSGGTDNDFDTNDVYVVIKNSYYIPAGTKNLTLTATGHTPFLGTANDVGTSWLLKHTRADNSTSTFDSDTNATPTSLTNAIRTKGDYTAIFDTFSGDTAILWRKEGNGEWQEFRSFSAASAFSATEDEEDVFYLITRSVNTVNGTFTAKNQIWRSTVNVTAQSSTSVATVSATTDIYYVGGEDVADNETSMWAEGAWGLFRGFPRTVTFFEDRLWWASSTNNPDTLWGSRSGKYEEMDFTSIGLANDSVVFPLNDNEVSQIQWMQARQVMAIGAANKEYRFGASDPDKPVTPSDRKATPQTGIGSDSIQPVILNDAIFFFQRQGRKLWAMKFDSITENFDADDATMLANTILESAPTGMAVQRVPDSIIWVVRTDGVLLSFTYEPKEEVAGWARHITQNSTGVETPVGFFESVTVIHGSVEDEVWVSVRRIINSVTVRYVERFATRFFDKLDEAVMLDSAVVVSSAFDAMTLVLASDTVRCNNGECNSSLCGGVVA